MSRGALLTAIALAGIAAIAIARALNQIDQQIDDAFADGDWPHLPHGMEGGRPDRNWRRGGIPSKSGRPFETHNVTFRTRHGGGI